MNIGKMGAVALAAVVLGAATPVLAHQNILKKIGSAIQYPVRKSAKNLSVDTHRAIGHNSVVNRHHGSIAHKAIVTPNGNLKPIRHRVYHHGYYTANHVYHHGYYTMSVATRHIVHKK